MEVEGKRVKMDFVSENIKNDESKSEEFSKKYKVAQFNY